MNAPRTVDKALARMDLWPAGSAQVVRRLGAGPTRETWLIEHGNDRYVLRMGTAKSTELGMDCSVEAAITRAAAAADLAPPCVAAYPEHNLLLTRYIDGRPWEKQDLADRDQLRRLAHGLHRLHAVSIAVRPFALVSSLRHYAAVLDSAEARTWASEARKRLFGVRPRAAVLCHNDLVAGNVIDDGRLWLIDWEFAGRGNPFFDLAIVVAHHRLDEALARGFLHAYLGRVDDADWDDLKRWCGIYERVLALWLAMLEAAGPLSVAQRTTLQDLRGRLS